MRWWANLLDDMATHFICFAEVEPPLSKCCITACSAIVFPVMYPLLWAAYVPSVCLTFNTVHNDPLFSILCPLLCIVVEFSLNVTLSPINIVLPFLLCVHCFVLVLDSGGKLL